MIKVKGVNIFPGQIDEVLKDVEGASSEYQVMIDHLNGRDIMTLFFETDSMADAKAIELNLQNHFKAKVGITIVPHAVAIGELPRSEKKSTRILTTGIDRLQKIKNGLNRLFSKRAIQRSN